MSAASEFRAYGYRAAEDVQVGDWLDIAEIYKAHTPRMVRVESVRPETSPLTGTRWTRLRFRRVCPSTTGPVWGCSESQALRPYDHVTVYYRMRVPGAGKVRKLAAIREEGYPPGAPAPCWFHCPCGGKVPAFSGDQLCTCGTTYDERGWVVS